MLNGEDGEDLPVDKAIFSCGSVTKLAQEMIYWMLEINRSAEIELLLGNSLDGQCRPSLSKPSERVQSDHYLCFLIGCQNWERKVRAGKDEKEGCRTPWVTRETRSEPITQGRDSKSQLRQMGRGTLVTRLRVSLRYGDYFHKPASELELQKVVGEQEKSWKEKIEK